MTYPIRCQSMKSTETISSWVAVTSLTHWGRDNIAAILQTTFSNAFSWIKNAWISPKISLKFVPKVRINIIQALVHIMAWCRPGDKPLSEAMMVSLLRHICVRRPQWVNTRYCYKSYSDDNCPFTKINAFWDVTCGIMKWKRSPHFMMMSSNGKKFWPSMRGIHRSPDNSTHKGSDVELWCVF